MTNQGFALIILEFMKNIYIVGFMATGKSAVGKILARELKREFVEMDQAIEQQEGRKIKDIFKESGEPYFRGLESKLLHDLAEKSDLVVSCGGGLICSEDNIKILKKSGIVINLRSSPEKIYNRTRQLADRPLLNVPDPLAKIKELFEKRRPYYDQAHYQIISENETPQQVAEAILGVLKKHHG